ncbi:hypothetical protein [Ligilactobacillus ruminis]|uniref:hypothetical protein n=1 Tax=Ligilactobacillus ruminis TaxID=1623 RepID=UPI001F0404E0|nr:hypothetical protein [Ligilactobacillus ruminis]
MEERNRNKRFRIESVYYESSMLEPRDDYSQEQYEEIADLVGKWSSFDLDKTDAYIYFDDLEKRIGSFSAYASGQEKVYRLFEKRN